MNVSAVTDAEAADGNALREVARLLGPATGTATPRLTPAVVPRDALLGRLRADTRCVLMAAPAGYGKTTALAEWVARDDRRSAWLTLSRADADPTALLARILLALDELEPIEDTAFKEVLLSAADLTRVRVPRLAALVERRERAFVLVLDDAHLLGATSAQSVVRTLVEHVPDGSCIAIGTRDASALRLSRARASGRVVDVGVGELAMSLDEGSALLQRAGLELSRTEVTALVDQSEGWPAGLYLWALALRDAPKVAVGSRDVPDDRVAEYLRDELLTNATPQVAELMLRTSILDRMSGSLCDALLEQTGSAAVIERLVRSNQFVVPLDSAGEWFRYHHLFQDLLRSELSRREPGVIAGLHARASEWFEGHGDVGAAIHHAHAAGDHARTAALIWASTNSYTGSGRTETVNRWLGLFPNEAIAADPVLALSAAWCCFTGGDMDAVGVWTAFAEEAAHEDTLPDGTSMRAAVELLRALIGRGGLSEVWRSATLADELDRPDSAYRSVACLLAGASARLRGDRESARACFERAAVLGALFTPAAHAQALGMSALLDIDDRSWDRARASCHRALGVITEFSLEERPAMALAYATLALVAAHDCATERARELAKHAAWLVGMLRGALPWMAIDTRIILARVSLLLGDPAEARAWLIEAESLLERYPDSGRLPEMLSDARDQIAKTAMPLGLSAAPLTAAELRVLRYLPTHLSFSEIADELFVSRNTVKTQAIAVYRKLEVSSRAGAVARARELGIADA